MKYGWLAVVGVVIAAAVGLRLRFAEPEVSAEETERRWSAVTTWAGSPDALGFGPLAEAVALEGVGRAEALKPALDWPDDGTVPTVAAALIPAADQAAVDGLLAWGEAPRYGGACGASKIRLLDVRALLRVALATAGAGQVDRARGVLATANAIRARGGWLAAAIGISLALDVARWAASRKVPAWPALVAAAPTADEYRAVAAREALCAADLVLTEAQGKGEAGQVLLRELVEWKLHSHATLVRLQIEAPTFATLRPLVTPEPNAPPPESLVVRTMEVSHLDQLSHFEAGATEHARLLARLPTEAPPAPAPAGRLTAAQLAALGPPLKSICPDLPETQIGGCAVIGQYPGEITGGTRGEGTKRWQDAAAACARDAACVGISSPWYSGMDWSPVRGGTFAINDDSYGCTSVLRCP